MGRWGDFLARLFGGGPSQGRQHASGAPRHSSLAPYLAPPHTVGAGRPATYPQHLQDSTQPLASDVANVSPTPLAVRLASIALPPEAPLVTPPVQEARRGAAPAEYTYALRDDFLSPAEASFFHVLRAAVAADYLIFPKVRLADLVFPPRQEGQFGAWQRINRKHIDFVLCAPRTLRPLVALELDDRSHRRPDRLERDAFVDRVFADAGLPLVHVPARRSYDMRTVTALIAAAQTGLVDPAPPLVVATAPVAAPHCARCGGELRLRTAAQGPRMGEQFWGCVNYPRCRQTVAVVAAQPAGHA